MKNLLLALTAAFAITATPSFAREHSECKSLSSEFDKMEALAYRSIDNGNTVIAKRAMSRAQDIIKDKRALGCR